MISIFLAVCSLLLICLPGVVFLFRILAWETPSPRLIYSTLGRDLRAGFRLFKVKRFISNCYKNNLTVDRNFLQLVKNHPNKICFLYQDEKWTYQQVEDYSNQIANAFKTAGYKKGDEVTIFMENRAEYVCIWLGLSKIGVISGLINTNLREKSLAHSINAINSKAIIFNENLAPAVKDVIPLLDKQSDMKYFCIDYQQDENFSQYSIKSLNKFLEKSSKNRPILKDDERSNFSDILMYIYTSGTTGLPKAAIIRQSRYIVVGAGGKFGLKIKDDDIFYNTLPLYHSAGGVLVPCVVLVFGASMAIRKNFSASNFWIDAVKYKATISVYIGEICRYLLNQPEREEEKLHKIRLITGVGLRPQLWKEFQNRFNIPTIVEFYGATEGNANVVNVFGKIGAVGFISRLFSKIYPVALIKVDPETSEPIRDKNGLCIRCKPGEPGVIVGKIVYNDPVNAFDGYHNQNATRKKIFKNCFQRGDVAFHSGDVLVMDDDGYLYFRDRTGDTFRWRGENVSTNEVEIIVSKALNLVACVVYGVEIPGVEGKAGMVAIQTNNDLDMSAFYKNIASSLPPYAVPLFARICEQIELTGTYKLRKVDLQKEGFDPHTISDPLYMLDSKNRTYVKLDEKLYKKIINGEVRL